MIRFQPGRYQSELYVSRNFFLTWEGIAVAVMAGVAAYSSYSAADNAADTAKFNEKVAKNAAHDAAQQGATESAEYRTKVHRMIASQNARFAAGGLDTAAGSPLDIMGETATYGELDALRIANNAQRAAAGYQTQANLFGAQADDANSAKYIATASSALSTASNMYFGAKSAGAFK